MIRATLIYIFVGAYILVLSPFALLWMRLGLSSHFIYILARLCIRVAGYLCGIKLVCHGKEKLSAEKNYVFLSNHQGNFDAPILIHAIPQDLRALIKKEMMRIPVLSLVLRGLQFVTIDRADPREARTGIDDAAALLRNGFSFFAFPEGTRSRNGRLGVFKKGVFVMALKAGVPIVPVSIVGSNTIQPPGKYGVRPGCVHLYFHDPISTAAATLEDREHLLAQTRAAIASALPPEIRHTS